MARAAGGKEIIDSVRRAGQFQETQAEVANEVDKLINKIGIVNVLALLYALNNARVANIQNPYGKDYRNNGWFSLVDNNPDCAGGVAINVDNKLEWQERWCNIGEVKLGLK